MANPRRATQSSAMEARRAGETMSSMGAFATGDAAAWIDRQDELLSDMDKVTRGWIGRRQEAIRSLRDSVESMRDVRDLDDLLRIQQEWATGSLRRLSSDVEDFATLVLNASQRTMNGLMRTTRGMGREAEQAQSALSTAGDKPEAAD